MSAVPEVLDALKRVWSTSSYVHDAGIREDQVLDGPPVRYIESQGVAIGASREDNSVDWTRRPTSMEDSDERFVVRCLAWAGSGDTTFKPLRDMVDALLGALDRALDEDRTLGDVVSTCWITSGAFTQEQTGAGALVMAEFTIEATVF